MEPQQSLIFIDSFSLETFPEIICCPVVDKWTCFNNVKTVNRLQLEAWVSNNVGYLNCGLDFTVDYTSFACLPCAQLWAAGETDRNPLLAMSQRTYMSGNHIVFNSHSSPLGGRSHQRWFLYGRLTYPDQVVGKEHTWGTSPNFPVSESSL